MSGKVIGKTLPFGYRGTPSRNPDTLIEPFVNKGEESINYGDPVVYDPTLEGVRRLKAGDTATAIVGIAVRRVGQPYADSNNGYFYAAGDMVDVLIRGSITVEVEDKDNIAPRGAVYADPATGELSSAASHTDEETSTTVNHLAVPNAIFTHGKVDSNLITEITILSRSI